MLRLFGRGLGRRGGMARGRGAGLGRGGGPLAAGPGGYCVCPQCGERTLHQRMVPCFQQQCPKCGARMVRE